VLIVGFLSGSVLPLVVFRYLLIERYEKVLSGVRAVFDCSVQLTCRHFAGSSHKVFIRGTNRRYIRHGSLRAVYVLLKALTVADALRDDLVFVH
jgi:hypothetical protein